MALTPEQRIKLRSAIRRYSFPPEYYDFQQGSAQRLQNTREVETKINVDLVSGNMTRVKNGLSNVLYWGYAQMGIRDTRVKRFRENVSDDELRNATVLFRATIVPSLIQIKNIGLPEFSGMSFVSKIRMFLDPENSATLDRQIMKIRSVNHHTVLENVYQYPTLIPITARNAEAYESWCEKVREISATYYEGQYRAADVERGFFQLVQEGNATLAEEILESA